MRGSPSEVVILGLFAATGITGLSILLFILYCLGSIAGVF